MSKTLIYIVNINDPSKQIQCSDYAVYSLKTWEYYCKKYNIDLIVCTEHDERFTYPIWTKELIYQKGVGYDKIGIVDSDTMVKWDAPNIFDQIEPDKMYGVNDLCDLNWLYSSIGQRQHFFPDVKLDVFKYLNAGVLFFGKANLKVFEELCWLYLNRQSEIDSIVGGGKEQTLLNFVIQKLNAEVELLTPEWNLLSIHKKNMFINNWQLFPNQFVMEDERTWPHFLKYGKIWHFTGFPIEQRVQVMQDVWNLIKTKYV